jgi:hypothetical protein
LVPGFDVPVRLDDVCQGAAPVYDNRQPARLDEVAEEGESGGD